MNSSAVLSATVPKPPTQFYTSYESSTTSYGFSYDTMFTVQDTSASLSWNELATGKLFYRWFRKAGITSVNSSVRFVSGDTANIWTFTSLNSKNFDNTNVLFGQPKTTPVTPPTNSTTNGTTIGTGGNTGGSGGKRHFNGSFDLALGSALALTILSLF